MEKSKNNDSLVPPEKQPSLQKIVSTQPVSSPLGEEENDDFKRSKTDDGSTWLRKKMTRRSVFQRPKSVMVYVKPGDPAVIENFLELYDWMLTHASEVVVYTEKWVCDEVSKLVKMDMQLIARFPMLNDEQLYPPRFFVNSGEDARKMIDNIVTLGGDGTVLWASKQFHGMHIPKLITFSLGSLGYLCEFEFNVDDLQNQIGCMFHKQCHVNIDDRLRLKVNVPSNPMRKIYRGNTMDWAKAGSEEQIIDYHILNEVVVDRGPCPTSVQLELYFDGTFITSLVGDGLIISTPTGSTAYNMSAGGSIVQVNTDCMCVTPLAPHSLSFRPLIISSSTEVKIRKPVDNRNSAWVSLDGATRFELQDGEELIVQGSEQKLGLIVGKSDNLMNEWAHRIRNMLNWNQREQLKPLHKNSLTNN